MMIRCEPLPAYRSVRCVARHTPRGRRRGAGLLIVIVVLFVASLILAVLVESVVRQHRQVRFERLRAQASWCAEAGLQRALAHLRRSPQYDGETRTFSLPGKTETAADTQAEVQIHVESAGEFSRISVVAEYPAGAVHRARVRRELTRRVATASSLSALETENTQP